MKKAEKEVIMKSNEATRVAYRFPDASSIEFSEAPTEVLVRASFPKEGANYEVFYKSDGIETAPQISSATKDGVTVDFYGIEAKTAGGQHMRYSPMLDRNYQARAEFILLELQCPEYVATRDHIVVLPHFFSGTALKARLDKEVE